MNTILVLCLLTMVYFMVHSIMNMKTIVSFKEDFPYKNIIQPTVKVGIVLMSGLVGFLLGPFIPLIALTVFIK